MGRVWRSEGFSEWRSSSSSVTIRVMASSMAIWFEVTPTGKMDGCRRPLLSLVGPDFQILGFPLLLLFFFLEENAEFSDTKKLNKNKSNAIVN